MALYEKTAAELSELLAKKEISAVELAKDVFARTSAVEDKVQGYVTLAEDSALAQAEAVDKKRAAGEELSALAGIPVAIKDNICTKGTLTTCASKMLYNFKPPYNATVMEKLAAHDVVVTGKANMDEFAMGSSCENSAAHPTHNPHVLRRGRPQADLWRGIPLRPDCVCVLARPDRPVRPLGRGCGDAARRHHRP